MAMTFDSFTVGIFFNQQMYLVSGEHLRKLTTINYRTGVASPG
jgi:hypothetical protein